MTDKALAYALLAEDKAKEIATSQKAWTSYLATASRVYKYTYHDQLLIHAQRPEATACAPYDVWNNRMNRYIRRGSKGIALLDISNNKTNIHYVFDISDTGERPNSKQVIPWEITAANESAVHLMLAKEYGVPLDIPLPDQLEIISAMLTRDYWNEYQKEILSKFDGALIESYDDSEIGAAFRRAAAVSTAYTLMLRCGEPADCYFQPEDFADVFAFNTPMTIAAIGSAVSVSCGQVLRQIEKTIKEAERSHEHERTDLHPARRLPVPEPDLGGEAGGTGQVREDAQDIPDREPPAAAEQAGAVREAVPAPGGDQPDSGSSAGTPDEPAEGAERRDGGAESPRSDAVGRPDEQPEGAGRRDDPDGAGVQLNQELSEQLNLFELAIPPEAEQMMSIDQAESAVFAPFAFTVAQEDIDHILRNADNTRDHRMIIVAEFAKQKPLDELARILSKVYHGGYGIEGKHGHIAAWFAEDGIHISSGHAARYISTAQVIPWTRVATRIGEMLEEGSFATNVEVAAAGAHENTLLAAGMWSVKRALSEKAREQGYLPTFHFNESLTAPDDEARIGEMLRDPDIFPTMMEECRIFAEAYQKDRSLLSYHPRPTWDALNGVMELLMYRREYESGLAEIPPCGHFITDDEINETLSGGGSFHGGKGRIYTYFTQPHTNKEKADFLKKEYGIGGHLPAISGATHSQMDYDSKGIHLRKNRCEDVLLKWNKVAQRIEDMIRKGRYLSPEALQQWQNEQAAREEPEDHPAYQPLRAPTQDEIDLAIQEWNGDVASKREVIRHIRGNDIDESGSWLKSIYGDDMPSMPISGDGYSVDLPWAEVHQHVLRLVEEERFFTDDEQDMFEDIDTGYIRDQLAERGVVLDAPEPETPAEPERRSYEVGDTIYLDGRAFEITEMGWTKVELKDPTQLYPIFRVESLDSLETLMAEDERNAHLMRPPLPEEQPSTVTYTTEEVHDAADTGLGFDVVVQSMRFNEPEPPAPAITAEPLTADAVVPENFHINDEHLGEGGPKAKYAMNVEAIKLLKTLEADGRQATPEEQLILSRYVGWGGVADAFDDTKPAWASEYAELKSLLTPKEYDAARASTLNAHYTSPTVIRSIYETLERMGFTTGNILEPAMGVGNFFGMLPTSMENSHLYGVELDSITGRIARQLYPLADITIAGFETTDRRDFYDVAIGNVPFGNYQVNDPAYNKLGFAIHDYFIA